MPINNNIEEILQNLTKLQNDLEVEIDRLLDQKRKQFHYSLKRGRVRFEKGMRKLQQLQKIPSWQYLATARIGHLLSAPFIYSLIIPFLLLDIFVTVYQQICFRIYGIARVKRRDHIIIDRHQLAYLNVIQKINCVYCGYGNGLIAYVREVAARTEQYWCPIKHARRSADPHRLSQSFVEYGDAENFNQRLKTLQQQLRDMDNNNA